MDGPGALPNLTLHASLSKVEDSVESAVKKVDDALDKVVERVPELAKVVEVVDGALSGSACSCGLSGWKLSASKLPRSPAKSGVLSSEQPK